MTQRLSSQSSFQRIDSTSELNKAMYHRGSAPECISTLAWTVRTIRKPKRKTGILSKILRTRKSQVTLEAEFKEEVKKKLTKQITGIYDKQIRKILRKHPVSIPQKDLAEIRELRSDKANVLRLLQQNPDYLENSILRHADKKDWGNIQITKIGWGPMEPTAVHSNTQQAERLSEEQMVEAGKLMNDCINSLSGTQNKSEQTKNNAKEMISKSSLDILGGTNTLISSQNYRANNPTQHVNGKNKSTNAPTPEQAKILQKSAHSLSETFPHFGEIVQGKPDDGSQKKRV